jgi:histidyl-tRNA synthetase
VVQSLSGFPEWLPAQRIIEQQALDTLRSAFELHGFVGIETRAVEPLGQLLHQGEIDKEVYLLNRLQADAAELKRDERTLGLHYDLTVPFARYVVENAGHLEFPFRRYQLQKAWRGERPQEGRYREFNQADIDVVGVDELPLHYDVELVEVMAEALGRLPLPPVRMLINNRKLVQGFYAGLEIADIPAVLRAVDKLDKIGPGKVGQLLELSGLSAAQIRACLELAVLSGPDESVVDAVSALGVSSPELSAGLAELATVLQGTRALQRPGFTVQAALKVARGLDYYTGTVYETEMMGYESLGSICSGGRYDALARSGRTTYPGVGLSFGVSRTFGTLLGRGELLASRSTPSCVLIAVASDESREHSVAIARALRARGIACEVAPAAQKPGRQIRFAQRRGIPYVWFPAELTPQGQQAVRDIRTGTQIPADPQQWQPDAADRKPSVTFPGGALRPATGPGSAADSNPAVFG